MSDHGVCGSGCGVEAEIATARGFFFLTGADVTAGAVTSGAAAAPEIGAGDISGSSAAVWAKALDVRTKTETAAAAVRINIVMQEPMRAKARNRVNRDAASSTKIGQVGRTDREERAIVAKRYPFTTMSDPASARAGPKNFPPPAGKPCYIRNSSPRYSRRASGF